MKINVNSSATKHSTETTVPVPNFGDIEAIRGLKKQPLPPAAPEKKRRVESEDSQAPKRLKPRALFPEDFPSNSVLNRQIDGKGQQNTDQDLPSQTTQINLKSIR